MLMSNLNTECGNGDKRDLNPGNLVICMCLQYFLYIKEREHVP